MCLSFFSLYLLLPSLGRDADVVCAMEVEMAGCLVINAEEEKTNNSGRNVWLVTGE